MVNRKHFDRVMGLMDPAKVVFGGRGDPETLKIQPTVLDNVSPQDPVMQEEIFGPVLPVLTFDQIGEALDFVNARPRPLALYLFSREKSTQGSSSAGPPSAAAASTTPSSTWLPAAWALAAWGTAGWAATTAGTALKPSPTGKVS